VSYQLGQRVVSELYTGDRLLGSLAYDPVTGDGETRAVDGSSRPVEATPSPPMVTLHQLLCRRFDCP